MKWTSPSREKIGFRRRPDAKTAPSWLVRELDLYVTATDLRGLPVHIRLDNADKPTADEWRHRNVFRFRYGTLSSDFGYDNNPFLAFAGRCASAIPPAFEPMRLQDIEPVLRTSPAYRTWSSDRAKTGRSSTAIMTTRHKPVISGSAILATAGFSTTNHSAMRPAV